MDEIVDGGAVADSPTAPTDTPATSAETVNTGTNGHAPVEKQVPFHQHPRWQQVMGENRQMREQLGQLQKQVETFQQMQQAAQRGQLTPEQAFQYQQAGQALRQIFAQDPELKALMDLAKRAPDVLQGVDGMKGLQRTQTAAHQRAARTEITSIAKAEGITSERAIKHLEAVLAQELIDMGTDAVQRYQAGDFSVFREAFDRAKGDGLIAATRQQSTAQTLQTKTQTRNLPPRPVGGQAGKSAPEQHEPGSKQWTAQLREKAAAVLRGGA